MPLKCCMNPVTFIQEIFSNREVDIPKMSMLNSWCEQVILRFLVSALNFLICLYFVLP